MSEPRHLPDLRICYQTHVGHATLCPTYGLAEHWKLGKERRLGKGAEATCPTKHSPEKEYAAFRVAQDRAFESDFDRLVEKSGEMGKKGRGS